MAPPRSHANGMRSDRQPAATPFHERDRGFESRLSGRPGPDSAEARNIAPMLWSPPSPSSPAAPSTARDIAELCLPYRRDAKLGHDAVTAVGAAPVAPCARGEDVTRGGPAARDTAPVRSRGPRDHLCVSPRNRQDRDRPRRLRMPDGPRSKAALQLVRRQRVALAPSWACLAAKQQPGRGSQRSRAPRNESPRHSRSRRRSYWTSACGARDESAEPATMR